MPEILNGKNVADFIDPDIEAKLEALEREEERLEAEGFYASDEEEMLDSDEEEFLDAAEQVATRKAQLKKMSQAKNTLQNKPIIPRKKKHVTLTEFTQGMRKMGHDPVVLEKRAARLVAAKKAAWEAAEAEREADGGDSDGDVDMDDDVEMEERPRKGRASLKGEALPAGITTKEQADKSKRLHHFAVRERNRLAKASESDRHVPITRPKWMLAGKRKAGKTQRR
jgi:nucleolar GTP-binding protein